MSVNGRKHLDNHNNNNDKESLQLVLFLSLVRVLIKFWRHYFLGKTLASTYTCQKIWI